MMDLSTHQGMAMINPFIFSLLLSLCFPFTLVAQAIVTTRSPCHGRHCCHHSSSALLSVTLKWADLWSGSYLPAHALKTSFSVKEIDWVESPLHSWLLVQIGFAPPQHKELSCFINPTNIDKKKWNQNIKTMTVARFYTKAEHALRWNGKSFIISTPSESNTIAEHHQACVLLEVDLDAAVKLKLLNKS